MKKKTNEPTNSAEEWKEKVIKAIDRKAFLLITLRNDGMGEIASSGTNEEAAFMIYHMLDCPQLHNAVLEAMAAYMKAVEDKRNSEAMPIIKAFES